METEKKKIEGYRLYILTFVGLSVLTLIAVGVTKVRLNMVVLSALVLTIASIQAVIVLLYNMHLKFQDRILTIFAVIIFSLISLTLLVTGFDYFFR
jgi:cytochrome c oxidase subunit 4